jgi:Flp pilus assembly pilin Flp
MKELMMRFVREEEGLETVEYAVMTALIIGAIVVAVGALATAISNRMDDTTTTVATGQ